MVLCIASSLAPLPLLAVLPRPGVARSALAFLVEAKQNSLRRERTSEKARLRNKGRTSEIKTRIKKVGPKEGGVERYRERDDTLVQVQI